MTTTDLLCFWFLAVGVLAGLSLGAMINWLSVIRMVKR
jgi:hypothetical protein